MRRIITAVGILLGVANGCPSPSSAATWPDCSRAFEKVAFTSGTISAVCGGKIAKAALDAATCAVVDAGAVEMWPIGVKYGWKRAGNGYSNKRSIRSIKASRSRHL